MKHFSGLLLAFTDLRTLLFFALILYKVAWMDECVFCSFSGQIEGKRIFAVKIEKCVWNTRNTDPGLMWLLENIARQKDKGVNLGYGR